jgi:hypothetical protein
MTRFAAHIDRVRAAHWSAGRDRRIDGQTAADAAAPTYSFSNRVAGYHVRRPDTSITRGPRSDVTEPKAGLVMVVFRLLNCG